MIAALYVQTGGCYFGLPNVDPWDVKRDARLYEGPYPVVAHPPCARWCRLAKNIAARGGPRVGDDGGCFASALASVRRWGGVLEHPAWSIAWHKYELTVPYSRGWLKVMGGTKYVGGEWVCEVSQAAYGHRAPKLTWLYYVGLTPPPVLDWSRPQATACVSTHTRRSDGTRRRSATKPGELVRMNSKEASATPVAFRDLLISIAESSKCGARVWGPSTSSGVSMERDKGFEPSTSTLARSESSDKAP